MRSSSSQKHDAVLLKIVTLARDVRHDGLARRELDTRDFTICRVGFFGCHCQYLRADALLLTVLLKSG